MNDLSHATLFRSFKIRRPPKSQVEALLGVSLMVGAALGSLILALKLPMGPWSAWLLASALVLLLLVGFLVLLTPRRYLVTPDHFIVDRLLRPVKTPLLSILDVDHRAGDALRESRVILGVVGYLGYWGRFRGPRFGTFRFYGSRGVEHVVIKTPEENLVITPEWPEEVGTTIRHNLSAIAHTTLEEPPTGARPAPPAPNEA